MSLIRVSTADLRAKADELMSLNASLKTNVSELEASEQNLASMWDGDAKEAFHHAFNNDKIQMTNFSTLIEKYVHTMENIAAKYDNTENTNVGIANTRNY